MTDPIVVVGAGLAGAKAVEAARAGGYDGPLVMYGEEPHRPYERPPLSKGYLTGDTELDGAYVHEAGWYHEHGVELRLGTPVTGLDAGSHELSSGGRTQRYSRLLLATGSTPRRLGPADDSGAPVTYLRTIEDSDRIKSLLAADGRLVVVGGGWVGLEVASAARAAGMEVAVVEAMELPLLRVLGAEVARSFLELHREHGVDMRMAATLAAVERKDDGVVVRLGDGSALEGRLLVVGVGITPNTLLAERAGLALDNGIAVDEQLRTSDPDVLAAGDVASAFHPRLGGRVRVEHWDNAIGQGTTAGRNLAGHDESYDALPYFFTDQYDLGMEYVGHVGGAGYDAVVLRGDATGERVFSAFWLRDGVVVAGMHANDWDAIDPIRSLVGRAVDADRLRDEQIPLTELAAESW
jgi:3-phenylpropionate/trans-cinnamate dioxygenase ferredoxin reductase subunit